MNTPRTAAITGLSPAAVAFAQDMGQHFEQFSQGAQATLQRHMSGIFGGLLGGNHIGNAGLPAARGARAPRTTVNGGASAAPTTAGNGHSSSDEVSALVVEMVRSLQTAGKPLTRKELHATLASKPSDGQLTYGFKVGKNDGFIVQQGEKRNAVYLPAPNVESLIAAKAIAGDTTTTVATAAPAATATPTPAAASATDGGAKAAAKPAAKKAAPKKAPAKKTAAAK